MNLPAIFFLFRWLLRETFRQALAARTFWLMLTVSALAIVFCLGVSLEGGPPLRPEGEIELVGADNQPLTGPNPNPRHGSLAFGAVRFEMFRDAEGEVRFLQSKRSWPSGSRG
jgi:hypothetical protein